MFKPNASTPTPKVPPVQRARVNRSATPGDVAVEAQLKLPNERDESVTMTSKAPDPIMEQAAKDVAHGLQDTSRAEQTNKAYKKLK